MQGWACHMVARSRGAISVSPLGLWVEPEDAQFLVAPTGLGETRRPRDGLVARKQFQHGEAARGPLRSGLAPLSRGVAPLPMTPRIRTPRWPLEMNGDE